MKLLTKFSLINMGVMVLIFLLSAGIINYFLQAIVIQEMDADLKGLEDKIEKYVSANDRMPPGYPLDEVKIDFVQTPNHPVANSAQMVLMYSDREKKMHNFRQMVFPIRFQNSWYGVTISKPVGGLHHLSSAILRITLLTILVTIILLLILNNYVLRRLWRPFYESLDKMRQFKLGLGKSLWFPTTSVEEFAFMNASLEMATRKAEQDYLLLKEFTENASHEMQTPLSIIRSKLDVLIQDKELSEKNMEILRGAYSAIKKISRLCQSLLLLAKIENRQFESRRSLNLRQKVEEKLEQFQELWQGKQVQTSISLQESTLSINPDLLDVLLNNLLSNALNHNSQGGIVSIELQRHSLCISNSGPNGSLDENRLFTRFYKESINSNSNGLGLYIIKQISKVSNISTSYSYSTHLHRFTLSWS